MNQFAKCRSIKSATALAAALLSVATISLSHASPLSDARALARGAIEDFTPQQRYQTAIREAGGGYKEWMRECARLIGDEQRICSREAKMTYDRDMAEARQILRSRTETSKIF